jgi:hypothetical protein
MLFFEKKREFGRPFGGDAAQAVASSFRPSPSRRRSSQ